MAGEDPELSSSSRASDSSCRDVRAGSGCREEGTDAKKIRAVNYIMDNRMEPRRAEHCCDCSRTANGNVVALCHAAQPMAVLLHASRRGPRPPPPRDPGPPSPMSS